jgi:hypothetical protein
VCSRYPSGACADAAFPGLTCEGDFTCQRQQMYFWQCAPKAATTTTTTPPAAAGATILPYMQCGGSGGLCAAFGACADAPFAGYGCSLANFTCQRQVRSCCLCCACVRWRAHDRGS